MQAVGLNEQQSQPKMAVLILGMTRSSSEASCRQECSPMVLPSAIQVSNGGKEQQRPGSTKWNTQKWESNPGSIPIHSPNGNRTA
jgi:hypothetical protein